MGKGGIMIVGLGDLAGWVLEFLARLPGISRIVAGDINEDWGIQKVNSAIIGAAQLNLFPQIHFRRMDVNDIPGMAAILREEEPEVIYNSTTLQSWWVITQLPKSLYQEIDEARYGPWFPMHFVLTHKLMIAIQKSGIKTLVANAAFPDAVNPVLAKLGLTPTVGIGNIDNLTPSLKLAVSRKLNVPLPSVTIYLIAPHFFSYFTARFGHTAGCPYLLRVTVYDQDVTPQLNGDELFKDLMKYARRPGSLKAHPVVAASAVKIIRGLFHDTRELGHAPGPNGLPGGYPVLLSSSGVEVVLPGGISLDEAVRINNQAQKFDGIEVIQDDGTVVITDKSAEIMKRVIGFDCKVLKISQMEEKAREMDERFRRYVEKRKT
jgi:hypothetical protein